MLSAIATNTIEPFIVLDASLLICVWNKPAERLFGWAADEVIGRDITKQIIAPKRVTTVRNAIADVVNGVLEPGLPLYGISTIRRTGDAVNVDLIIGKIDISPSPLFSVAIREALVGRSFDREQVLRHSSLLEFIPEGVFTFGTDGTLQSANRAFCALTGHPREELIGMHYQRMVAPECVDDAITRFQALCDGAEQNFDIIGIKQDGTRYHAHITSVPVIGSGEIVGVQGVVRDVTVIRENAHRAQYLATYDVLTGLPNRTLLNDRLRHAIAQAERHGGSVGLLYLDLNRFKVINDSLGHEKGDVILRFIADRLQQCVREADTVARIGGDEFVLVLEDVTSIQALIAVARNVVEAVERPMTVDGQEVTLSTSVGSSLYPKDGRDAATLIRHADLAMYEAKAGGNGSVRFFTADMNERVKARLVDENELRRALDKKQLVVHYQPQVDICSQRIVGVEALVRWQHPDRGLVAPNEFIPLAEEIGLINRLGAWVLEEACKQNRRWQVAGVDPIKVSVNLSPHQLAPDSRILESVLDALKQAGLSAEFLGLEITESSLMQNVESTLAKLLSLRTHGVSIAIDDFGTGYSSLSYLRQLPIDVLKIDQSFIRDMMNNRDDAAIVAATIALAHTMKLKVVAEGVTSYEQLSFLQSHECDEVQGFLLGAPVAADTLAALLSAQSSSLRKTD
ncbi:putative bifunctional diguanylate cyclase/phosphodiesterase [Herbaspirillum sp. GCM10030257]|uniref:putative bifunctional diguanylate cyclase/phosphodiesterase n=1 Tax=Herbaspirillum sp. GCM10030257 TaxID=3273393 RepID=UPI00361AB0B3